MSGSAGVSCIQLPWLMPWHILYCVTYLFTSWLQRALTYWWLCCSANFLFAFMAFLYLSISPLFIPPKRKKKKKKNPCSCLAFSCICYAVDLAILRIGCVHFAPLVYVTDALFCMVAPHRSTWIPLCPVPALTARGWLLFVLTLTSLSACAPRPSTISPDLTFHLSVCPPLCVWDRLAAKHVWR